MAKLVVHPGVKKWIVQEIVNFLEYLEQVSPAKQLKKVELCPAPVIAVNELEDCGFGVTVAKGHNCYVAIACDWLPYRKDGINNRDDAKLMFLSTLAHEWHHVEQHRDGREFNHRGTQQRMKTFLNGYLQSTASLKL
jgi:hypothetical protein